MSLLNSVNRLFIQAVLPTWIESCFYKITGIMLVANINEVYYG